MSLGMIWGHLGAIKINIRGKLLEVFIFEQRE